jgi:hypothetical protein
MLARGRPPESEPVVLVAYGSGILAGAVARRLAAVACVELRPAANAAHRLRHRGRYDAVVLCPYLTDRERRRVRDAMASAPNPSALVHLRPARGDAAAAVEAEAPGRLDPVLAALRR